jgi:hypothetical protein
MADTPEQMPAALARELIRDGDTDRVIADSRAAVEIKSVRHHGVSC